MPRYYIIRNNQDFTDAIAAFSTDYEIQLNIGQHDLTTEQLERLVRVAGESKQLKAIVYIGNYIPNAQLNAFAKILEKSNSLYDLTLDHSHIDDVGTEIIARALINNHSLKELSLGNNDFCEEEIKSISAAILVNNSLSWIDLSYNNLFSAALKILIAVLTEKVIHIYVGHPGQAEVEILFKAINSILDFRIEGARFLALEQAQTGDTNPPPPAVRFFGRDGDHAVGTRVMRFLAEKPSLPFTRAELDTTLQSLRAEAQRLQQLPRLG